MKKTILPIFASTAVIAGEQATFNMADDQIVTIEAPGSLIQVLTRMCDGKHPLDEIIEIIGKEWDQTSVRGLINKLMHTGILVDGRFMTDEAWRLVQNPIGYPLTLNTEEKSRMVEKARKYHQSGRAYCTYRASKTGLGTLLKQRRSIRSFSGEVELQSIINMLWAAYGETVDGHRTVPSAGALYPLMIHVALWKKTENLKPAVYRIHLSSPVSVGFELVSEDINLFTRSFIDPMTFQGAHGVIVISGSFQATAEKYGTRSMLFVTLEAGHAAQNVNMIAVEQNVATVEVGGFRECLLTGVLHLPKHYHPLITTAFGGYDPTTPVKAVDPTIEVRWDIPWTSRYQPPFAMASARVIGRKSWSHGRDATVELAYLKATSEAREWASCGSVPKLTEGRFCELAHAVDPRSVIRFHEDQYRREGFPFTPFSETGTYAWTTGYDEVTGQPVYILGDLVYFPYFPKTPYYMYANSSGVAAHPNRERAVQTSALELVERDSFMIAYLAQLSLPTIKERTLPQSLQMRIRALRKIGFKVWVKDHSLDLAPVVSVIAQSDEYECTICSSCASFDIEYAVDHALKETEAPVVARLHNGKLEAITPKEVVMPLHHGMLYGQKQYYKRADFLTRGSIASFQDIGRTAAHSWPGFLRRVEVKGWRHYTVNLDLSPERGGNQGLNIVRSIIPGMVPMTFGAGQEPGGMDRIYSVAREFGGHRLSYAKLTKFPHPFE